MLSREEERGYELHQQRVVQAQMEADRRGRETDKVDAAYANAKAQPPDIIGPTRASTFPEDAKGRKQRPVASGVMDYFPDAIVAVAQVSWAGNEQHNPGTPLHWARNKSSDEADAMMRHFLQRGSVDDDGIRHSAKMVWRALALLQKEIEAAQSPRVESEPEYRKRMGFDDPIAKQQQTSNRNAEIDNTPDARYMS